MFKSMIALVKGHSHEAAQSVVDQNAMVILRQQIRESAEAVKSARKAVAIAIAQNEKEEEQHNKLVSRIEDLEERTIEAMQQGQEELAREAAETIAVLEAEKQVSEESQKRFKIEINRLKNVVRQSETRLRELQRGQRLADATDKTQRLREATPNAGLSSIQDAEATLSRLQDRQKEMDAAAAALDDLTLSENPETLSQRLSEAGCGKPIKSTADQVLERLANKKANKKSKSQN